MRAEEMREKAHPSLSSHRGGAKDNASAAASICGEKYGSIEIGIIDENELANWLGSESSTRRSKPT